MKPRFFVRGASAENSVPTRFEPRDLGVAALDPAAESDGQAIGEIGVEEAAFRLLRELQVEVEAGRAVGRAVRVPPGCDVLAAAGKEAPRRIFREGDLRGMGWSFHRAREGRPLSRLGSVGSVAGEGGLRAQEEDFRLDAAVRRMGKADPRRDPGGREARVTWLGLR